MGVFVYICGEKYQIIGIELLDIYRESEIL